MEKLFRKKNNNNKSSIQYLQSVDVTVSAQLCVTPDEK